MSIEIGQYLYLELICFLEVLHKISENFQMKMEDVTHLPAAHFKIAHPFDTPRNYHLEKRKSSRRGLDKLTPRKNSEKMTPERAP